MLLALLLATGYAGLSCLTLPLLEWMLPRRHQWRAKLGAALLPMTAVVLLLRVLLEWWTTARLLLARKK